jgi:sulfite exporter TauE/SafE
MPKAGFPFIILGIAFVAIGISTNRTFMFAGLAFIILGFAVILRGRRR